ncbi:MAG TPA: hypothetical protein DIC41_04755 [Alphaproteobacteria bacterium]|jgi:uncharacterized protein with GYD domain|nr:hypothetical protein [Rhodospirillaceae bacterium]PDH60844.1 MAG: hypothetical protein CNE92_07740 [SAR116 cluster bacterium MED-G05]HAO56949.1 hypothetical protein [Alphaproteobacteria bacterium]MAS73766.1 hypothetical protein [Rhodospirillaceae bacterium]HBD51716.1 hypothetical protein [Alphaproteobacteria bacterium]|tara:strand:+ start:62 stop:472 length:411 start_codon:yes stop_codon:yes gene_type:complete
MGLALSAGFQFGNFCEENTPMNKYVIHGKTSSDFAAAMLNKPQNRREILDPFFSTFNIEVLEFCFTNGVDINFVSVVKADGDETLEAMSNIVYSTGNFSKISWSRAFDAEEYKAVFEKGHEKMNAYVSSMKVAGTE